MKTQPTPTTLDNAILLADKLATITRTPAHVVNDHGHIMLASSPDIGVYWQTSQIVYTAGAVSKEQAA